ncbi:MAG: RNase adapter RapZ [Clostridiales bacterium]|nr:RNase adapter RapZ [Clostridiales bacterium]
MQFFLLTGMSGAGKTVAIRYLEDLGALCVDNLPPMMLVPFMEACQTGNLHNDMVAIGTDIRSGEFFDAKAVTRMINEARLVGYHINTLFIEASDEVLVNRYKEQRREHPLASEGMTLERAIREERNRLQPLRETANYLIDTSTMRPRMLQKRISEIAFETSDQPSLRVDVLSFGFKRGLPREGDLVFDVRFLPNPFYIPELGHHTGLDEDVRAFVLEHPVTQEFLVKCMDMIQFLLPNYITEGKHRLVIAVGCTGGAHRSVAIAEYIGQQVRELGYSVNVNHRDIALEQAHWAAKSEYQKGEP